MWEDMHTTGKSACQGVAENLKDQVCVKLCVYCSHVTRMETTWRLRLGYITYSMELTRQSFMLQRQGINRSDMSVVHTGRLHYQELLILSCFRVPTGGRSLSFFCHQRESTILLFFYQFTPVYRSLEVSGNSEASSDVRIYL